MRQAPPPKTWFQKIEKLHPYETLLYLGMLGSGIIFLFLALAFLSSGREYLRGLNEQMPLAFLVSTFLLVLSGYTAVKMRIHYQEENSAKLHRSLKATFVLGLLFTVFQRKSNIFRNKKCVYILWRISLGRWRSFMLGGHTNLGLL